MFHMPEPNNKINKLNKMKKWNNESWLPTKIEGKRNEGKDDFFLNSSF